MSDWEDAPDDGGWEDAPAAKPAAQAEPTAKDRILAAEGGVNRLTVAGTLGLPVDTVTNIINLAIAGYEAASPTRAVERAARGEAPREPITKPFLGSEHIAEIMDRMGFQTTNPRPDDPVSKALYTGAGVAAGGLPFGAKQAVISGLGASTAQAIGGDEWTGVGAMTPGAMLETARNAKAATAARTNARARDFWAAGATPSVGQATGSAFVQGLENLASKFPGGAGVMKAFRENQQTSMGASVRTGVSAEDAGRAIERGVKGPGGFLDKTKAKWLELDDAVAAKVPAGEGIAPSNTLTALGRLTEPTPGAEATSGVMATPKLAQIRKALKTDMEGEPPERVIQILGEDGKTLMEVPIGGTPGKETMPYQAIRELRSKVGAMLDDALVTGIPGGELKQVYGALSKDLEAAANKAGAGKEFARQNDYYRARMARIEGVLEKVIGKDKLPEDIFKSFMPTDPDAANKVRSVMRSLPPEERLVVSHAVVNRLGRASPGRQLGPNDDLPLFSSETFLTNWNRLSPGAKSQLFEDPKTRKAVDTLAGAAAEVRESGKVFSNPSGTAGSFAAYSVYASPIAALAAGSFAPLVAAAGAAGSAYVGARMLTSPKVVEWLAAAPKIKPQNMPAHLARLGVIYNEADDETKSELDKFMQSLSPQEPDWDKKGKLPPFTGAKLKSSGVPVQPYAMATRS